MVRGGPRNLRCPKVFVGCSALFFVLRDFFFSLGHHLSFLAPFSLRCLYFYVFPVAHCSMRSLLSRGMRACRFKFQVNKYISVVSKQLVT